MQDHQLSETADLFSTEIAQQSLTAILRDYPGLPSQRPERLSEEQVGRISELLDLAGRPSWSKIPRIYTVLHMIDKVRVIDSFVNEGISDLWFPFSPRTLPEGLRSASDRYDFIEVQDLVLTKAFDLEREDGKHRHFSRREDIPLRKLAELGKGGFGSVDRVLSTITHREYARKMIPRGKTFRKNAEKLRDFERELSNLKKLRHTHIVELVGSYTDQKSVCILMAPVADANLREFLTSENLTAAAKSLLRTFYGCLATAVQYLHENQVRHKDIKPQNILVKGHQVYLTDFGISLDWSDSGQSTTTGHAIKTERYCAPEVAKNLQRNSLSDLWSLGCVFLEIWTVLKGETLTNLHNFIAANSVGSTCYHSNREVIMLWCTNLQAKTNTPTENPPYDWIEGLLEPDQDYRWPAQKLVARITDVNDDPENNVLFLGHCCVENDDSTISEVSSRRSSRLLDETGASSIAVYEPPPPKSFQYLDPRESSSSLRHSQESHSWSSHQRQDSDLASLTRVQSEESTTIKRKPPFLLNAGVASVQALDAVEQAPVPIDQQMRLSITASSVSSPELDLATVARKPLDSLASTHSQMQNNQPDLSQHQAEPNRGHDSLHDDHESTPADPSGSIETTAQRDISDPQMKAIESFANAASHHSEDNPSVATNDPMSMANLSGSVPQADMPEPKDKNVAVPDSEAPPQDISGHDIQALVDFLEHLKSGTTDRAGPSLEASEPTESFKAGDMNLETIDSRNSAYAIVHSPVTYQKKTEDLGISDAHQAKVNSQDSAYAIVHDPVTYQKRKAIPPTMTDKDKTPVANAKSEESAYAIIHDPVTYQSPKKVSVPTTGPAGKQTTTSSKEVAKTSTKSNGSSNAKERGVPFKVPTKDYDGALHRWREAEEAWRQMIDQPTSRGDDLICHPSHTRPSSGIWWVGDDGPDIFGLADSPPTPVKPRPVSKDKSTLSSWWKAFKKT